MPEVNDFNAIRISLASPEQIRFWSYGEVTKAETINYRTLKPEKDGLFCERIFGPTKDYECYCGKYKKIRYKGVICDRCGVEVAPAKVRRERMGHIELVAPVAHIWFVKGIPSQMGLLLDISPRNLERVIYFAQYIITRVDEEARQKAIQELEDKTQIEELEELQPRMLLTESRYRELKERYGNVFEARMGAEALLDILKNIDLNELRNKLRQELNSSSAQRCKKAMKRLRVVEAFHRSGNKPEWMILTALPVLPPELRPMVQLDGGRFATSDLNDLYRRVINRNNRLRHLLQLGAPEIIIRNEKRMLQEAVNALIDSGKQERPIAAGSQKLKSLSDLFRGKQGRFRQNLLGKRVDYSGRSVIVVGPELKLHQCGLPKRMALELYKPFVMSRLIQLGIASNPKSARRMVERARPEVWDALEEVVKERPIFLNRAPTLHRLGIQAFEPVLIDGSAIQIHPLVCAAFNADFDGDQMAVHLPLSKSAVQEAREAMLSTHNMLLPSNGEPVIAPTLDIVFGCYYLTLIKTDAKGEGSIFSSFEEARLAYDLGIIDLGAEIEVLNGEIGQRIKTCVGRIIFNEILPKELRFLNETMDKSRLKQVIARCHALLGDEATAAISDDIKELGFRYATKSGTTIAIEDIEVPKSKKEILRRAEEKITEYGEQCRRGLITEDERFNSAVQAWTEATDEITNDISQSLSRYGGIYMMSTSGAKGNISQIRQMAGMRGLMTDPSGRIIEFPITSGFREGLSVFEYFISTHGARKGLSDTALRTSGSGYLTRRLIDVSQSLVILEEDCGTTAGIWLSESSDRIGSAPFSERMTGRLAASKIVHPDTGEIIVDRNEEITEEKVEQIVSAGITDVYVRSPLGCQARRGLCQHCYGRDMARGRMVSLGTAVGIVAAESIGEPGTQLTLRTFHTGGVAGGVDITSGLPRVEEIFEARTPKGEAIISEIDGVVNIERNGEKCTIKITNSEWYQDTYQLPPGSKLLVKQGEWVEAGTTIAPTALVARVSGRVAIEENMLSISYEEKAEREYTVPLTASIRVENGARVKAGDRLTEGNINPQDILRILGIEATQRYLVNEVQKVYRSQGVNINDKHIEVIVRQMLHKVRVESPGDTELLPGELVSRFTYEDINAKVLAEGGEPATAQAVLLGITRAALSTDSFLAAASFQETTKVLTEAAVMGKTDRLLGLKENVIIGRLIPAYCSLSEEGSERIAPILTEECAATN